MDDTTVPLQLTSSFLEQCSFFETFDAALIERARPYLTTERAAPGHTILREGDHTRDLYVLLDGNAVVRRKDLEIATLGPGAHFGELGLFTGRPRAASVVAEGPVTLARLREEAFLRMEADDPALALAVLKQVMSALQHALVSMDDNVHALLAERALPRRRTITARLGGEERTVRIGTPAGMLLPAAVNGALTVAALLDRKAVSLNTALTSDVVIEPLTTASWEGQRIFRWTAGLVVLEAAQLLRPPVQLRMGPSVGWAQIVEVAEGETRPLAEIARALDQVVARVIAADRPCVTERVSVEEAVERLTRQGWVDAVESLGTWRDSTVPLVNLGATSAICTGPALPSTGLVGRVQLAVQDGTLLMQWGEPPNGSGNREKDAGLVAVQAANRATRLVRQWAHAVEATTVGSFNVRCIDHDVSHIIRVSESFHEKYITHIADEIAARRDMVRVISIAGPSSSGKTTFIKRLTVQLQVNGMDPVGVSLDDYYVDREATIRDAEGNFDFENIEALDLPLLHKHLKGLALGEKVRLARFDFPRGKSLPEGGAEVQLAAGRVLLMEGIHGLNPRIVGGAFRADQTYRVFINAMSALPFDRATLFNVSDLRLLRRIVRDRHHRATDAAETIARWPSVRRGEQRHIFPYFTEADAVFDSALIYEPSVLKVYADLYLLEVPRDHPSYATAFRLRHLIDRFVTLYPNHVPQTSILREFIGGSGFEY